MSTTTAIEVHSSSVPQPTLDALPTTACVATRLGKSIDLILELRKCYEPLFRLGLHYERSSGYLWFPSGIERLEFLIRECQTEDVDRPGTIFYSRYIPQPGVARLLGVSEELVEYFITTLPPHLQRQCIIRDGIRQWSGEATNWIEQTLPVLLQDHYSDPDRTFTELWQSGLRLFPEVLVQSVLGISPEGHLANLRRDYPELFDSQHYCEGFVPLGVQWTVFGMRTLIVLLRGESGNYPDQLDSDETLMYFTHYQMAIRTGSTVEAIKGLSLTFPEHLFTYVEQAYLDCRRKFLKRVWTAEGCAFLLEFIEKQGAQQEIPGHSKTVHFNGRSFCFSSEEVREILSCRGHGFAEDICLDKLTEGRDYILVEGYRPQVLWSSIGVEIVRRKLEENSYDFLDRPNAMDVLVGMF